MGGLGAALTGAASAIGTGAKAAGSDLMNTAKNSLFGIRHPVQASQTGGPQAAPGGGTEPLPTDSYADTTMGKLFGAGQPSQGPTPAQMLRRNTLANY